jgi:hypothetical protein
MEILDCKVFKEILVHKVFKEMLDVLVENKVFKVFKVYRAKKGILQRLPTEI